MPPNRPETHNLLSIMETWKRTDYTNTQDPKLKHTIQEEEKGQENQTGTKGKTERERQEEILNFLEDKDPDPNMWNGVVPVVQHRVAWVKREDKEEKTR